MNSFLAGSLTSLHAQVKALSQQLEDLENKVAALEAAADASDEAVNVSVDKAKLAEELEAFKQRILSEVSASLHTAPPPS